MNDRIRLDPTLYEPVDERRPDRSPEELAGRCVTIETDFSEEGSSSTVIPTTRHASRTFACSSRSATA